MLNNKITLPGTAGVSPRTPTPGRPEASASAPAASPGDLPLRNVSAANPTAGSLPPRSSLPATAIANRRNNELLKFRDVVTQWLQLPEAQLKGIINSQDEKGDSALHTLAKSTSLRYVHGDDVCHDTPDLMRSLLEKGADPRLVNHDGKTPAEYVDHHTHILLAPRVGYELAHAGPVNRQRLEDNHAAFATDPVKALALANARKHVKASFQAIGGMFNKGPNQLKPFLAEDAARFASGLLTPGLPNSVPFFSPAEHAKYSLFDVDGRVSDHVTHGFSGEGARAGNNLVLRFEPGDAGQAVLKGIVFPRELKGEDGTVQCRPHTTAYGGGTFSFAGEISADTNGRITSISNMSGHNRPKPVLLAGVTLYLQSQELLTEDFSMVLAWHPRNEVYEGVEALDKARELIGQRLPEINAEARARLKQEVAGLEQRLRQLDDTSRPEHRLERSKLSRQRALAYSKLKQAAAEDQFLTRIGYDPSTQSVSPHKAPPRGSYREAKPEGLAEPPSKST